MICRRLDLCLYPTAIIKTTRNTRSTHTAAALSPLARQLPGGSHAQAGCALESDAVDALAGNVSQQFPCRLVEVVVVEIERL